MFWKIVKIFIKKKSFNEIHMRQKNKIYIFNGQGQLIGSDKHSGTSKPAP